MTLSTRIGATVAAVAIGVTAATAPAHAERVTYEDPADAAASSTDIRTVRINHARAKVRVVVGFTELRRRAPEGSAGLTIALDTDPEQRGAEYRLGTGLQAGTDYQLMRVRQGRVVGEPLTCAHRVRLRFARDRLVFRAARACLGAPDRLRIGVRMHDRREGAAPVVDWLGEPRSLTDWVARA